MSRTPCTGLLVPTAQCLIFWIDSSPSLSHREPAFLITKKAAKSSGRGQDVRLLNFFRTQNLSSHVVDIEFRLWTYPQYFPFPTCWGKLRSALAAGASPPSIWNLFKTDLFSEDEIPSVAALQGDPSWVSTWLYQLHFPNSKISLPVSDIWRQCSIIQISLYIHYLHCWHGASAFLLRRVLIEVVPPTWVQPFSDRSVRIWTKYLDTEFIRVHMGTSVAQPFFAVTSGRLSHISKIEIWSHHRLSTYHMATAVLNEGRANAG